jgi:hypothetical protein
MSNPLFILSDAIYNKHFKNRFLLKSMIRKIITYPIHEKYEYIKNVIDSNHSEIHSIYIHHRDNVIRFLDYLNRYYIALTRFQRIIKYQNLLKFDHNETLESESFDEIPENELFIVNQNNTLYTFYIYDIMRLLRSSLLTTTDIMVCPKLPKNPYNNMELDKTILYNFYIHMKINKLKWDTLVYSFFKFHMNVHTFVYKHMVFLREYGVKEYIRTESNVMLIELINEMFDHLYYYHPYDIIPHNTVVRIHTHANDEYNKKIIYYTQRMLFHYLMMTNNIDNLIISYHTNEFIREYNKLMNHKPEFWKLRYRIPFRISPTITN